MKRSEYNLIKRKIEKLCSTFYIEKSKNMENYQKARFEDEGLSRHCYGNACAYHQAMTDLQDLVVELEDEINFGELEIEEDE